MSITKAELKQECWYSLCREIDPNGVHGNASLIVQDLPDRRRYHVEESVNGHKMYYNRLCLDELFDCIGDVEDDSPLTSYECA